MIITRSAAALGNVPSHRYPLRPTKARATYLSSFKKARVVKPKVTKKKLSPSRPPLPPITTATRTRKHPQEESQRPKKKPKLNPNTTPAPAVPPTHQPSLPAAVAPAPPTIPCLSVPARRAARAIPRRASPASPCRVACAPVTPPAATTRRVAATIARCAAKKQRTGKKVAQQPVRHSSRLIKRQLEQPVVLNLHIKKAVKAIAQRLQAEINNPKWSRRDPNNLLEAPFVVRDEWGYGAAPVKPASARAAFSLPSGFRYRASRKSNTSLVYDVMVHGRRETCSSSKPFVWSDHTHPSQRSLVYTGPHQQSNTHLDETPLVCEVMEGHKYGWLLDPSHVAALADMGKKTQGSHRLFDLNPFMEDKATLEAMGWKFFHFRASQGIYIPPKWIHCIRSTLETKALSCRVQRQDVV